MGWSAGRQMVSSSRIRIGAVPHAISAVNRGASATRHLPHDDSRSVSTPESDHAVVAAGRPTAIGFTSSRPATNPPMCAMYATPPDSVVFAIDPMPLMN
jgi:hypothetical protein